MASPSKRTLGFWTTAAGFVLLGASLLVWWWATASESGMASGAECREGHSARQPPQRRNDATRTRPTKRETREDRVAGIRLIRDRPEELLALVGELSAGDLGNDREILQIYLSARFTPEQFGAITGLWNNFEGKAIIVDSLASRAIEAMSIEWTKRLVLAMPVGEQRSDLLFRVAKATRPFSPDALMASIEGLSGVDKRSVGEGISARLTTLDFADRKTKLQEYYDSCVDPAVLGPLAESMVGDWAKLEPENAVSWSLESPPEFVSAGDRALIHALGSDNIELSTSFLNRLVDLNQVDRASKCVSYIASSFFVGNPKSAVEWAVALPPEIGSRRSILVQNLYALNEKDPAAAQDIVRQISDQTVAEAFEVVKRTAAAQTRHGESEGQE